MVTDEAKICADYSAQNEYRLDFLCGCQKGYIKCGTLMREGAN